MLAEERREKIVEIVDTEKATTVQDLADATGASLATIRRDLVALDEAGLLFKVHGGATSITGTYITREVALSEKIGLNDAPKQKIGRFAATLIDDSDFVFIDAGTTTEHILDDLIGSKAIFVTDSIIIGTRLLEKGLDALIVGGQIKTNTAAIIGSDACTTLSQYNFSVGFFGTNGVSKTAGYTTPESQEASVKAHAFKQCKKAYVLADASKFGSVSSFTFAEYDKATVITDRPVDGIWAQEDNIIVAS